MTKHYKILDCSYLLLNFCDLYIIHTNANSIIVIEKPIYGYGKKHNDYGLAFYCTESLDLAKEWAVSNELDGYANCYELDLDGLNIINLMEH